MLDIVADCSSIALRRQVEKRFRLRQKIRQAVAETMGSEDYGTIHIESQWLEIALKKVICRTTIGVHHFSQAIEIRSTSSKGHSKPVTQLIEGCENGTLATYLELFLVPHSQMNGNSDQITFTVHVCDIDPTNSFKKMKSLDLRHLQMLGDLQHMPYNFNTSSTVNIKAHTNKKNKNRKDTSVSVSVSVSLHSSGSSNKAVHNNNDSILGRQTPVINHPIVGTVSAINNGNSILGTSQGRITQFSGHGYSFPKRGSIEVIVDDNQFPNQLMNLGQHGHVVSNSIGSQMSEISQNSSQVSQHSIRLPEQPQTQKQRESQQGQAVNNSNVNPYFYDPKHSKNTLSKLNPNIEMQMATFINDEHVRNSTRIEKELHLDNLSDGGDSNSNSSDLYGSGESDSNQSHGDSEEMYSKHESSSATKGE